MCGISGIIDENNNPIDKHVITLMNDKVAHRGPDGEGYYFGPDFAFGHRRLAILDPTEDGRQPMELDDRYVIIYNGEVYNYIELREELQSYGYSFKTGTDTEVILAAYDKWGAKCVDRFNGMWSFAIYDKEKDIIFCSRDRFGIKPFYYAEIGNNFVFGSEIKQFTVLEDWKAGINRDRVLDFLAIGIFDHTNETLFEGVYQLRGGHNLIYDLNGHTYHIYPYYFLKDRCFQSDISSDEAGKRFNEIFEDAVRLRLRSDVKVGSCLSGGLDSSSIVCVANRILRQAEAGDKQETVSSCFEDKRFDEQEYIDEVAKLTEVMCHKVFPNFEDLFAILDNVTWYQDEPFGSTSIFAQWNVFGKAKENNITVMLDGQGADEHLAGYHGFFGIFLSELLKKFRWIRFFKEVKAIRNLHGYSLMEIARLTGKYFLPNGISAVLKRLVEKDTVDWLNVDKNYYKKYMDSFFGSGVKSLEDYSLNQLMYSSLPMLLHYEDRDSMAHSIEARVPFLDYRLVEFVMALSPHYKIRNGITKYILRDSMKDILPGKVKNRMDKMGFVTPEEIWIKENKEQFKRELSDSCDLLNNIINKEKVLNWYDNLVKSDRKIDYTLWRIISLGRWVKVFKVSV